MRTALVTTVSWEDRFLAGLEKTIVEEAPDAVVLCRYDIRENWTMEKREDALVLCERHGCPVRDVSLAYSDAGAAWVALREEVRTIGAAEQRVVVDISTMARETMWNVLLLLAENGIGGRYMYTRPESYGGWTSRDPGRPRLALKLGGEMMLGKPTMLLIVTGFDWERTLQLIRTFDPVVVRLAIQEGDQFDNASRNRAAHEEHFRGEFERRDIEIVGIDAYRGDHGFGRIMEIVEEYAGEYNVLMASLGPKLSGIALYRVQRLVPAAALVYSPSNEYNRGYSKGAGSVIVGRLPGGEYRGADE